jgi:hypothetical protein
MLDKKESISLKGKAILRFLLVIMGIFIYLYSQQSEKLLKLKKKDYHKFMALLHKYGLVKRLVNFVNQ